MEKLNFIIQVELYVNIMCQGKRQKHSFIYNFENSIHYYETNVLYVIYILLSLKNQKLINSILFTF